ncbi:MAG TPA: tetratricopeptide repeat protein [Bacillota bacterium]|jgi:tetratricopeptide (TPR) repeat protein|nr:tetratricopeptide repeat protein [Bacillota bacterium]HOL09584.1 tetratricopeptide repeat protein [Bacillota bacterium]HPO97255.1 tetratricopeptide repeat protein [Bacillota bacterium]
MEIETGWSWKRCLLLIGGLICLFSIVLVSLYFITVSGQSKDEVSLVENGKDIYGYPVSTVNTEALRQMLQEQKFGELNQLLEQYYQDWVTDFRNEYVLSDAYDAFAINDQSYQGRLDQWVKKFPTAYQPYLARASFFNHLAWESRGYRWASETSAEQFANMKHYFQEANQDLQVVLEMEPNHLVAYDLLLSMNTALGNKEINYNLIKKALQFAPNSFLLRSRYIHSIRPRWGGSYQQMRQFAKEAQKFNNTNPRLKVLLGFANADLANVLTRQNCYWLAELLYTNALAKGHHWGFYEELASCYLSNNKSGQALKMINQAIELRPQLEENYLLRAEIYSAQGNFDGALADLLLAEKLNPGYSRLQSTRERVSQRFVISGYNYHQSKQNELAFTDYERALKLWSNNAEAFYWRAKTYIDLKQFTAAEADLKAAITINPTYFEAVRLMDWILFQGRRFDEIISYWTRYLEQKPDDAQAYLERGGAYFHKRDWEAAMRDAKAAADLGHPEGKKRYEEMKQRLGI